MPALAMTISDNRVMTRKRLLWMSVGIGTEELFDLAADPWELRGLARDPGLAGVLERLRTEAELLEPFGVPAAGMPTQTSSKLPD